MHETLVVPVVAVETQQAKAGDARAGEISGRVAQGGEAVEGLAQGDDGAVVRCNFVEKLASAEETWSPTLMSDLRPAGRPGTS